jgi:ribonucleoside-diphosphate reductase beta chain
VSWSVRDESLHCEGMIRIFHTLAAETGALTQGVKDDIVECCRTVVRMEDAFIDLAFSMGPVQGMTADDIKKYIRYIADWRLGQLKLQPIFGVKEHPIPWLSEILNGVEHANFFEQRATEYSKGATGGDWHGAEGVWANFDKSQKKVAAE